MSKRILIAALLVLIGAVAGWLFARVPARSPTTGDLKREPAASAWPADQAWSWTFDLPKDLGRRSGLSLRLHAKSSTLAPHEEPVVGGQSAPMSAEEAERKLVAGALVPGDSRLQPWSGHVTVQLLDLSRAGVASSKPGRDLRVLANFGVGGSRVDLAGDDTVLPAGRIGGQSIMGEGQWTNDQLYLMSFDVQDDRKLWHYDVFLEHNPSFNAPR
jgi:hypothetical protein